MSDAPGPESRQTFRSPVAVVIWWLWVLFAVGNLIDLAVQGRDHGTLDVAFAAIIIPALALTIAALT